MLKDLHFYFLKFSKFNYQPKDVIIDKIQYNDKTFQNIEEFATNLPKNELMSLNKEYEDFIFIEKLREESILKKAKRICRYIGSGLIWSGACFVFVEKFCNVSFILNSIGLASSCIGLVVQFYGDKIFKLASKIKNNKCNNQKKFVKDFIDVASKLSIINSHKKSNKNLVVYEKDNYNTNLLTNEEKAL